MSASPPDRPPPAPRPPPLTPEEVAERKRQIDEVAEKVVRDGQNAVAVAAKVTRAIAHAQVDPVGTFKKVLKALFE